MLVLQDAMPHEMRNSDRYKRLILDMPGTGRGQEEERLEVATDWARDRVLPLLLPVAESHGFGDEWRAMLSEKTPDDASRASRAASAATDILSASAAEWAKNTTRRQYGIIFAAQTTAHVAINASHAIPSGEFWDKADPIGVLERMTYLGETP